MNDDNTVMEYEDNGNHKLYKNGELYVYNEYDNGENVKQTVYEDGKPFMITEYENGETIKDEVYEDGKLIKISEYYDGEEIRSKHYKNGKLTLINEYDDFEIVRDTIYENEKVSWMREYEDSEDKRGILFFNGELYSVSIFENDEEVLKIIYTNNEISDYSNSENDITIDDIKEMYDAKIILKEVQNIDNKNRGTNAGYVYVLVNSSIKDMVKIGKTTRTAEERAKELSSTTGVPTPYVVAYECFFNDCSKAEKYIHNFLEKDNHRTSKQREFFNISSSHAIQVVMDAKEQLES